MGKIYDTLGLGSAGRSFRNAGDDESAETRPMNSETFHRLKIHFLRPILGSHTHSLSPEVSIQLETSTLQFPPSSILLCPLYGPVLVFWVY